MIVHKYIVHVLDRNSEGPILNDFEGKNNMEIDKFFEKVINKVTKDDDLRQAVFKDYNENIIRNCCEQIIYDDSTFVQNSKEIASFLFDIMKKYEDIDSCDLAMCLYSIKDEKYVGIVKLDYKKLYTHSIELLDEKFNIQIISNEIGIPETGKQKQAALVGLSGINDDFHLRLLDKDSEKEQDPEKKSRFINEFLNAEKINDDKFNTKTFKATADNWITNAMGNNIKRAEDVRSILNYTLKEKEEVDIEQFMETSLDDEALKESFRELIQERGIESNFNIDKKWVEKKLKKRSIKTDSGFDIKGNLEDFEDPMKYSVRQNQDGTVDIVIKNVSFFEEK